MRELLIELTAEMNSRGILYDEAVREFRKVFILTALRDTEGNLCRAAKRLGLHRNTLARNIADLQVNVGAIHCASKRHDSPLAEPSRRSPA